MDLQNMLLFVVLNFIIVVLSVLRSITTAKSTKHIAAFFNVTSYTFYSAIVFYISAQELWFVVATTAFCNLIGYYTAEFIFNKSQKDKLWRISCIVPKSKNLDSGTFKEYFDNYNIEYQVIPINDYKDGFIVDIFSCTQMDSIIIKEIIKKYEIKNTVIQIEKTL